MRERDRELRRRRKRRLERLRARRKEQIRTKGRNPAVPSKLRTEVSGSAPETHADAAAPSGQ